MNPEIRQTLNTISRNLESANEAAQERVYTFTQLVIDPCLSGIRGCLNDCTATCFPKREDRMRRRRARSRGRSDLHFDFYDDWDDEEDDNYGAGSWGDDELDSLLAGRGVKSIQPGRQRAMSYGARNRRPAHAPGEENPNIIPSSSYLGFLERFKWRPGARGVRYKPSAADLQEQPSATALGRDETEPLIEESEDDDRVTNIRKHRRQRSDTENSRSTTNSLSSRGDLIMGDEEEDAQPLDDEFAVMLTRTNTGGSRRPGLSSRKSARTASSKSSKSLATQRSNSSKSLQPIIASPTLESTQAEPPSLSALRAEEEHLRREQELEIAQKREAAIHVAKQRGLSADTLESGESQESKPLAIEVASTRKPSGENGEMYQRDLQPIVRDKNPLRSPVHEIEQRSGPASPVSTNAGYHADSETEPFPSFPTSPSKESEEQDRPP